MQYSGIDNDTIEAVTIEDITNHRLIPLSIYYSEKDNVYTMKTDGYYNGSFKIQDNQLKLLLRRMCAKDDITLPRTKRLVTYQQMIDGIKQGKYNQLYCWKSKTIKSSEDLSKYLS